MIPKTYEHFMYLSELQDEKFHFVQNDWELKEWLDTVSFPKRYREDITGCVVWVIDGEIEAIWFTEMGHYYDLWAVYHALPYYRPKSWAKKHLPNYWLEDNPAYQKENKR